MADVQVLIVGAGPTGLAAALFLARRGVEPVIIDAAPEATRTSKALGVNPRTLDLLKDTGVAAAIIAEGQSVRGLNLHQNGRPLARIEIDWLAIGARQGMVILPQARTEALLTDALADLGVSVQRGVALAGLDQDENGVTAHLTDGRSIRCAVLFGADGAHSTVRKAVGVDFVGDGWAEPWQLMDVDLEGPDPHEGWIDLRSDGPFVCLPFSGRTFRLIGFGPPLLERLPHGWRAGQVQWRSDFHISHRIAERLAAGRVCLGGDAAHIHSPLGARGMNLGIEDAWVFAACAGDAVKGDVDRLADYGRLRHSVDRTVVSRVRGLTAAVRETSWRSDLLRRLAVPLVAHTPPLRRRLLQVGMGLDHPVRVR